MWTIICFLLVLVSLKQPAASTGVITGLSSHEAVSAKVENLMLTIRWDNDMTAQARLSDDQKELCIFPGKFVQDRDSEVLVTGCEDEDELSVQFQSEKYGSQIFAVTKSRAIVDEHPQEDDFEDENPDFDLLFELDEPDFPSKVVLHLNIYLDPKLAEFYRHVGMSAKRVANQIVAQANLLMNHNSLKTKVELVFGAFYNSTKHLGLNTSTDANDEYDEVLPKLLREPFNVGGDPVVHVYLTSTDGKINGKGKIASLCSSTEKPRIVINGRALTAATAVTLSHELGHVLGMHHDFKKRNNRASLTCAKSGEGEFILDYASKNGQKQRSIWSSCSNDDFKTYYSKIVCQDGFFCLGADSMHTTGADSKILHACKNTTVAVIIIPVLVLVVLIVGGVCVYSKKKDLVLAKIDDMVKFFQGLLEMAESEKPSV